MVICQPSSEFPEEAKVANILILELCSGEKISFFHRSPHCIILLLEALANSTLVNQAL